MNRQINLFRHGVGATLQSLATAHWRISIDGGRGGQFEHQGSRESAENRAGWECWCYQRMSENPPTLEPGRSNTTGRSNDLISGCFDQDDRPASVHAGACVGDP